MTFYRNAPLRKKSEAADKNRFTPYGRRDAVSGMGFKCRNSALWHDNPKFGGTTHHRPSQRVLTAPFRACG